MKTYISRLIIGAAIVIVGGALLLDGLNIVDTSSVLKNWWPLLIVAAGVAMFINDSKNYIWAFIVMAAGVFVQLRVLGYYSDINVWQVLLPLVLIVVGVSVATGRAVFPQTKVEEGSDDVVAILGGSDHINSSEDFVSSKVTAILGGAKIDIRKATIKKAATVELFTIMGGVEIVVPRGVIVVNKTNSILGGIENKTDQEVTKSSPTLTILGDVIMGGVEIKN